MTTFRKKLLFLPFSLCLILFNSCTSDTDPKKDQRPESKTCTRDEFCGEREICFKGNCVETKSKACSDDSHCRVNEICDKNLKVCRSEKLGLGCEELKDCPFGAICLDRICRATKELNYCNYKDKCDQNSYCDSKLNICRPYIQCGDSTGCPDGFYCEIESKFCKLVKKDLDCDPKSEKSTCSHSQFCHEGKCVECFKDQHCPTELICKKSVMKCLGKDSCGSDTECKKNYYCEPRLYQCVPKNRPCLLELDCPVGYSCDQTKDPWSSK